MTPRPSLSTWAQEAAEQYDKYADNDADGAVFNNDNGHHADPGAHVAAEQAHEAPFQPEAQGAHNNGEAQGAHDNDETIQPPSSSTR